MLRTLFSATILAGALAGSCHISDSVGEPRRYLLD